MRRGYYQRLVVLIFASLYLSLSSLQAVAATVPAYNGRMNAAVGSLVQSKVGKWGFAANDPRIGATTNGVASGLTTLAVGVASGAVAAVGWPALLVAAGISALVGGAVSLASDAITKWLFNADGTVTAGAAQQTEPSHKSSDTFSYGKWKDGSAEGIASAYVADYNAQNPGANYPKAFVQNCYVSSQGENLCTLGYVQNGNTTLNWMNISVGKQAGVPYSCDGLTVNGVCQPPAMTGAAPVTSSVSAAVSNLSAADAAKPISDELLAAAVNSAWKASDMSKGGLPWSASDPITPADVAAWRVANPSMVPTVGDAIAPVSSGSTVSVAPSTSPSTSPSAPATPGSGTKVDLGSDPNIGAPALEPTPTASQILSPLFNLMPDLKSFAVPSHTSTCPTGSFSAFQKQYTFDSHCSLIESNRSLIEAAAALCWALSAIFIVLRA